MTPIAKHLFIQGKLINLFNYFYYLLRSVRKRPNVDFVAKKNSKVPSVQVSGGGGRCAAVRVVVKVFTRRNGHRDTPRREELYN